MVRKLRGDIPVLDCGHTDDHTAFSNDRIVAAIVTILLIPQSLGMA
ncbi:MAG: hypothetical protein P8O10_13845 [Pseudorhodobacter sp.]|nr:hypothetical protein [Pseudorhodobacter sp.]